jgi:hypothetical protein
VALACEGHNGAVGLHDMLWTGKAVASGWAGLGVDKAWMMLSGLGNYFLISDGFVDPLSAKRAVAPLSLSVVLQLAILIASAILLWPRRHEPVMRAVAVVFLGTWVAGEVLNIYAQPQDPQMQLNVMPWLTVAWALLVSALRARPGTALALAVLSFAPLVWNIAQLSRWRGGDTAFLAALAAIEQQLPPEKTVFVYWGFEPITVWQYALWSRTWDWDGKAKVEPAPSNDPRFKWIAITAGAIRHPHWTPEQHAAALKSDIDLALERGYRVAISDAWTLSVEELAGRLAALSAAGRAPAIHKMLHDSYEARRVFSEPTVGAYYELRRR